MTRRLMQLVFAAGLAAGIVTWAAPAQAQNGTMNGRVLDSKRRTTDRDGKPLAGKQSLVDFQIGLSEAIVTLEFKGEPAKKTQVITDQYGEWYKSGLAPGTYDISVRREWTDPVAGRATKPVVFIATAKGLVLKPGEKLKVPDMGALTEEALAAGEKPPVMAAAGATNAAIEAANKRAAELENLLKDANALFDQKKYAEAIVKYTAVATKLEGSEQSCARCYVRVGESQVKLKDLDAAEKAFLKALEINPEVTEAYTQLAALYNTTGKLEEAAKMSAKANELLSASGNGGDASAMYNQGVIFWNAQKAVEARDAFAKAVKIDPNNASAQYYLGLTTFSAAAGGNGKMIDAKAPLEAYLKLAPTGEFADSAKGLLAAIK